MLTKMYIEALLIDEDLADQVWDAWYSGLADDLTAFLAWLMIANVDSFDDGGSAGAQGIRQP